MLFIYFIFLKGGKEKMERRREVESVRARAGRRKHI